MQTGLDRHAHLERLVTVELEGLGRRFFPAQGKLPDAFSIQAEFELSGSVEAANYAIPGALQANLKNIFPVHGKIVARGDAAFRSQGKIFPQAFRLAKIGLIVGIALESAIADERRWDGGIAYGPRLHGRFRIRANRPPCRRWRCPGAGCRGAAWHGFVASR